MLVPVYVIKHSVSCYIYYTDLCKCADEPTRAIQSNLNNSNSDKGKIHICQATTHTELRHDPFTGAPREDCARKLILIGVLLGALLFIIFIIIIIVISVCVAVLQKHRKIEEVKIVPTIQLASRHVQLVSGA